MDRRLVQSIELFCADFAIGFLPPATFLLATANITIVKMLHKEFEVLVHALQDARVLHPHAVCLCR